MFSVPGGPPRGPFSPPRGSLSPTPVLCSTASPPSVRPPSLPTRAPGHAGRSHCLGSVCRLLKDPASRPTPRRRPGLEEVPLIPSECPSLGLIFPRRGDSPCARSWAFVSECFSPSAPPECAQAACPLPSPASCFWPAPRAQSLCPLQFRAGLLRGLVTRCPPPSPGRSPPSGPDPHPPPRLLGHAPARSSASLAPWSRWTRRGWHCPGNQPQVGPQGGAGPSPLGPTGDPQPCPGGAVAAAPRTNLERPGTDPTSAAPAPDRPPHGPGLASTSQLPSLLPLLPTGDQLAKV